jgi:uncharacterized membrane protein YfcA
MLGVTVGFLVYSVCFLVFAGFTGYWPWELNFLDWVAWPIIAGGLLGLLIGAIGARFANRIAKPS